MAINNERVYTTIDKSGWGDGPWQSEPDKVQWTDEVTGLPCLVVRGSSGALCGYVGVAEVHPWFKKGYNEAYCGHSGCYEHRAESLIEVHGGLTYADLCQEGNEAEFVCHIPEPGQPDHVWWFGFDCAHSGDISPAYDRLTTRLGDWSLYGASVYRDLAYVQDQCGKLAAQLAEVRTGTAVRGE